jgi:hypothetical protein
VAFWANADPISQIAIKNIKAIAANNKRPVIVTGW